MPGADLHLATYFSEETGTVPSRNQTLIRHDTAHILAQAVQELFPGTQVTIGPAIDDGFYYDFARDEPFSLDDLPKIEAKMHEIVNRDLKITTSAAVNPIRVVVYGYIVEQA